MSYCIRVQKREFLITTSTPNTPNSPSELLIQNHTFTLDELETLISKLTYNDKDNLIFHLIQNQLKFHFLLLEESKTDDSINKLTLVSDITKLKIIKDLYETI